MKKLLSLTVAVILGIGTMFANPVDVNTAKTLGQKFVLTNFEETRGANLELVYTFSVEKAASFYVFNVDDNGFVVVSADDKYRPIVGFGKGEIFDTENPERMYYLNALAEGRALERNQAGDDRAAEEWESLRKYGRLLSYNRGTVVDYLVQTKWNQNPAPYNSACPADPAGPGGHVYVGCVATAMAQIMKYWNYPTTGQGSHTYYCPGHGQLSANFGATTYDWDNMLNSYSTGYTTEEGEAVAILGYHCGVSVDMYYDGTEGSGTSSSYVPNAVATYFRYSTAVQIQYKGNLTTWLNTLKSGLDKGWPMYYSGTEAGANAGHAFICDGYDDADYFHFNWGWGGSGDNWFLVGDIDYNTGNATITNFVPADVYNNSALAPANLNVEKTDDLAQEATVSWVNPSKTLNNSNITSIDQIVVMREGEIIRTFDNPTPGESMSFVDDQVPCYSTFEYSVYAVIGGAKGNVARASEAFGPMCTWNIVATSSEMTGWKDGKIVAYDGAGREITSFTMTNNTPTTAPLNLTIGKVMFAWKNGSADVTLSFKLKDSTGNVVYEKPQGSSADIPEGFFCIANNGCGNAAPAEAPGELVATRNGNDIILSWTGTSKDLYGYNIYRDGYLIKLNHDVEFVDEAPGIGGHCYEVCYIGDGGESEYTNESCATSGEGCNEGKNLWYTVQPTNFKPILTWEGPDDSEGLSGYYVYRKAGENDEYKRVKILGPNKLEYKETGTLTDGVCYYYRVYAYYKDIDCMSAPCKALYGNVYHIKYLYSVDAVDETMAQNISVYPNPAKDMLNVKADNLSSVVIYNSLGQKVFAQTFDANEASIDMNGFEAGIYMVRIVADGNEVTRKISVIK